MRLVILGAGGHGQTIAAAARDLKKYEKILFLDDNFIKDNSILYGPAEIETWLEGECKEYSRYINKETEFYPAFGDNKIRLEWENKILRKGGKLATIIHPTASVSSRSKIEK